MTGWFIDAIDARGGLAVATRRGSDLRWHAHLEEGPSFFVSPPAFTPESITARSTGFALARRFGQLGLFLDGAEVEFDSVAAVVEFVRRCYLRGAGGDGPGESGGGPPPRPTEPGEPPPSLQPTGERPPRPEPDSTSDPASKPPIPADLDPARSLLAFADFARAQSAFLPKGRSDPPRVLSPLPTDIPGSQASRRLARAGLRLIVELVSRLPSANSPHIPDWFRARDRLAHILARMGLWPLIMKELSLDKPILSWLEGQVGLPRDWLHHHRLYAFNYIDGLPRSLQAWFASWHGFTYPASDPFQDLALLPVPQALALPPDPKSDPASEYAPPEQQSDRPPKRPDPNLQMLLTALVAAPAQSVPWEKWDAAQGRIELALFASAWLNLGPEIAPQYPDADELFLERLTAKAFGWLKANLPKLVYFHKVEEIIETASSVAP